MEIDETTVRQKLERLWAWSQNESLSKNDIIVKMADGAQELLALLAPPDFADRAATVIVNYMATIGRGGSDPEPLAKIIREEAAKDGDPEDYTGGVQAGIRQERERIVKGVRALTDAPFAWRDGFTPNDILKIVRGEAGDAV